MSDEAEKAAKYQMIEDYKKAQSHLSVLERELKIIGKEWEEAGRIFQNGKLSVNFSGGDRIVVSDSKLMSTLFKSRINWDSLITLLSECVKTQQEVLELRSGIEKAGLSI